MKHIFYSYALVGVICFGVLAAEPAAPLPVPRAELRVKKLDAALAIRFHADTVEALVRRTAPRFVFHDRDLVWITHNETGKVGFAMNRVYHLKIGNVVGGYYLIEAAKGYYWPDPQGESFRYTRTVDADPIIFARDPRRGVVYQARWASAPESGSGALTETRNIFLLCDGEHRWHLLGEGPSAWRGALGADEYYVQSIEAKVTWTDDAKHPATLSYTLLETDHWDRIADDLYAKSLAVCWGMRPSKPDLAGLMDGIDPGDVDAFRAHDPHVIESQAEPLSELAARVAHCSPDNGKPGSAAGQAHIAAVAAALRRANPGLADPIRAGKSVVIPDVIHVYRPEEK